MPRPKMRRETVIVSVSMERDLALHLKKMARERGLSTSALIERLLYEALGSETAPQIPSDPLSLQDPDPPVDPLVQVEIEEFESELGKFEKEVEELEQVVKATAARGWGTSLLPHRDLLKGKCWKKVERWHSLRRFYSRLKPEIPVQKAKAFSARLAESKKRLNQILQLVQN